MKRISRYVILCVLLALVFSGQALVSPTAHAAACPVVDYPTFGYDMQRTSWNTAECILSSSSSPTNVWIDPYAGTTVASQEGISTYHTPTQDLAFLGVNNKMVSLQGNSGAINWTFGTGAPIVGAATVYSGLLFFGSKDTRLYAVKPTSGGLVWANSVGVPISTTPAGFSKFVIVSMDNGVVYSFDAMTGGLVWASPFLGKVLSSPAIFQEKVYVSALVAPNTSVVFTLDAWSGNVLWTTPKISGTITTPVLANQQVYIGASDPGASVLSFDPWSGAPLWQIPLGEPVYGKPAADIKQLYVVGGASGKLFGIDAYGAGINWITGGPFAPIYRASSPTVANGVVYVGTVNNGSAGWVYAFKLNGSYIWNRQVHGMVNAPVTVVNGWFYTDTYDGSLSLVYAYKA